MPVLCFIIFWFSFFLCIATIFLKKDLSEFFLSIAFQRYIYPHCYAVVHSDCLFFVWLLEFVMVVKYFLFFFSRYQYVELKGVHVFFSSDPIYNFPQLAIDVLYSCSGCTLHFNYRGFLYFHFWFSDFTLLFIFFF